MNKPAVARYDICQRNYATVILGPKYLRKKGVNHEKVNLRENSANAIK